MEGFYNQIRVLAWRILLLLLIYQLARLIFLISNLGYFSSSGVGDLVYAFVAGVKFDVAAVFTLNALIIIMHLVPGSWFYERSSQLFIKIFFLVINVPAILLNCIDLEYFKFQGKRTTADLFHLFGMGDDMKNTIPQMMKDFWYVLLVFVLLTLIMVWLYNRIKVLKPVVGKPLRWSVVLIILPILLVTFVAARGGFQYKPLNIMAAAKYTTPQLVPLVLNTPFTVYKTLGKATLEEKKYLDEEVAYKYFNKVHHYRKKEGFKPMNVVLLIMESFSSEYIGALNNGVGYTPFLDSLMGESMVYTNAYANAKKSIDGIPSVVASMPSLLPGSYISSPYNGNRLRSIAGILKSKGYASGFFHGGNNGTMGFDNFTLMTGFENYYGRKEYPGKDYDGHWGVFDESFYYFFIDKCNTMKPPFVNAFFALSSHHPYSMPDSLRGHFPKGALPIHESIGYADYALGCFFREAKKTNWYKNTLFVITSDHTGPSAIPYYQTKAGMFRVPIIFYSPSENLKGSSGKVTQQTSIVPGILDYLRFDEPFVAFGNSMFDSTANQFAVNYTGDVFQVIGDQYIVHFDGNDAVGMYDYKKDIYMFENIVSQDNPEKQHLVMTLQSVLQQFNSSLIKNDLIPGSAK